MGGLNFVYDWVKVLEGRCGLILGYCVKRSGGVGGWGVLGGLG